MAWSYIDGDGLERDSGHHLTDNGKAALVAWHMSTGLLASDETTHNPHA